VLSPGCPCADVYTLCLVSAFSDPPPRGLRRVPKKALIALVLVAALGCGWLGFQLSGWFVGAHLGWPSWLVVAARIAVGVAAAIVGAGAVTWARRPASAIWRAARRSSAATRCGLSRAPLSVAILLAVGVGVVLAYGFYWVIGGFVGTKEDEPAAKIDVYKTALAGVAGIGGAAALVVAYRRQRDAEQGRFVERFGAAAAQLGDQDVAVRIAGVYAMAGVADECSDLSRRQQCIDVLCGYLRLPYDPEHGSSHRTEHVTKFTRSETPITSVEEQVTHRLRQNDREVRQTIVRVICAHLQDNAENSWSNNDFDFTGVLFENVNFGGATFSGEHTNFNGATFSGEHTVFNGATFSAERTVFGAATFSKDTAFDGARFSGEHTDFGAATFSGKHTDFGAATFSGEHTDFGAATFSGKHTDFGAATFSGEHTDFGAATFSGERTFFGAARFSGERTDFGRAIFSGKLAWFENPQAWNNVTFDWDEKPAHMLPECIRPRDWPPTQLLLEDE
jgi:uncharacterized protein YjbI with pentapeptide repeats